MPNKLKYPQEPFGDYVSITEIAQLAGVTPQAVWNWTKMPHRNFPQPDGRISAGPLYLKTRIMRWLSDNGYAV